MKKILVAILAVSLLSLSAEASNGGGKKARKKAKTECKKDNTCDVKNCDPKDCDPSKCDPKDCPFPCPKEPKCQPTECAGSN